MIHCSINNNCFLSFSTTPTRLLNFFTRVSMKERTWWWFRQARWRHLPKSMYGEDLYSAHRRCTIKRMFLPRIRRKYERVDRATYWAQYVEENEFKNNLIYICFSSLFTFFLLYLIYWFGLRFKLPEKYIFNNWLIHLFYQQFLSKKHVSQPWNLNFTQNLPEHKTS